VIEDRSAAAVGSSRSVLGCPPRRWSIQDGGSRSRVGGLPRVDEDSG
jgi:hypothetical protein